MQKTERKFRIDIKWIIILSIIAFLLIFEVFPLLYLFVKSIFPKNSTSMDFRYKTDKQGNDNIPNTFTLDLYVVKIWIDVFDTIIYDTYNT